MLISEKIDEIASFFEKGLNAKEKARLTDLATEDHLLAVSYMEQAVKAIDELLAFEELSLDARIWYQCIQKYYIYEMWECHYTFRIKQRNYASAQDCTAALVSSIDSAISLAEANIEKISPELKTSFSNLLLDWHACRILSHVTELEPQVKVAFHSQNYIKAIDLYSRMLRFAEQAYQFSITHCLREELIRITQANISSLKMSLASASVGAIRQKDYENKPALIKIMLSHLIEAYESSQAAIRANLEWDGYQDGPEKWKENIRIVLCSGLITWDELYLEFRKHKIILQIMSEIDFRKFREICAIYPSDSTIQNYNIQAHTITNSQFGNYNTQQFGATNGGKGNEGYSTEG